MDQDVKNAIIKSELDQLMYEFIPNISLDYVLCFKVIKKESLFFNFWFLKYIFSFTKFKRYYLLIEFVDGGYVKFKIDKSRKVQLIKHLIQVNQYLSNYRIQYF